MSHLRRAILQFAYLQEELHPWDLEIERNDKGFMQLRYDSIVVAAGPYITISWPLVKKLEKFANWLETIDPADIYHALMGRHRPILGERDFHP
jgi:hypothetical protein